LFSSIFSRTNFFSNHRAPSCCNVLCLVDGIRKVTCHLQGHRNGCKKDIYIYIHMHICICSTRDNVIIYQVKGEPNTFIWEDLRRDGCR
jgi:hypothetical protein